MDRHLFLFGGGPPFTYKMARKFSELVSVRTGKISLLIIDRPNWKEYMPKYTKILVENGITEFQFIPLPTISEKEAAELLKNSAGIIIGGGNTEHYAKYIVETTLSRILKEQFSAGVPIAGFSAGALISMEHCIISANDNEDRIFKWQTGLGLLKNTVIAVHFSEWMDENHLRKAVIKFQPHEHFGIDEGTGMYFYNNRLMAVEGNNVFQIKNNRLEEMENINFL
ncbi:Type 1 glutamine amidotransferase-like domain-containing protein [Niallia circulans]|uniref:Type 1 glutamine amidotransferase-like domain-containing protein n=1 Tax=Niallia circulans TaxID=1397 RepID=UPI0011AA4C22|nr:Type 1 glutamine amidotransferase-like domain-containing protein [Niallia circulans]MED5102597.1 Type 1 glutamine amidotransferase-like domain-containing protein [Niallia circulans]